MKILKKRLLCIHFIRKNGTLFVFFGLLKLSYNLKDLNLKHFQNIRQAKNVQCPMFLLLK